jgi:hypothetical protein
MKEERIVLKMADNEGTSRYVHHSLTTDITQNTGTWRNNFQNVHYDVDFVKAGFVIDDLATADEEAYEVMSEMEHRYNKRLRKAIYNYTRRQWDMMVKNCEHIESKLKAEFNEELLRTFESNTGRKRKDVA